MINCYVYHIFFKWFDIFKFSTSFPNINHATLLYYSNLIASIIFVFLLYQCMDCKKKKSHRIFFALPSCSCNRTACPSKRRGLFPNPCIQIDQVTFVLFCFFANGTLANVMQAKAWIMIMHYSLLLLRSSVTWTSVG